MTFQRNSDRMDYVRFWLDLLYLADMKLKNMIKENSLGIFINEFSHDNCTKIGLTEYLITCVLVT